MILHFLAVTNTEPSTNGRKLFHAQVRRKGEEENLAEWLVEITVTPDADAGTSFAAAYDRCSSATYQRCSCSLGALNGSRIELQTGHTRNAPFRPPLALTVCIYGRAAPS